MKYMLTPNPTPQPDAKAVNLWRNVEPLFDSVLKEGVEPSKFFGLSLPFTRSLLFLERYDVR